MSQVSVVAIMTPTPGREAELAEVLLALVPPTRQESGCLRYDLLRDPDRPGVLVFLEDWESRAAHRAHKATPHFVASRARQEGLVAARDVRILEPLSAPAGS